MSWLQAHLLLLQTQAETITMIALTIRIPVTDARTGTTILTRTFLMWWYSLFSRLFQAVFQ